MGVCEFYAVSDGFKCRCFEESKNCWTDYDPKHLFTFNIVEGFKSEQRGFISQRSTARELLNCENQRYAVGLSVETSLSGSIYPLTFRAFEFESDNIKDATAYFTERILGEKPASEYIDQIFADLVNIMEKQQT